jgi:alpha-beta hydrolase superfamily lysophospholipase
MPDDPGGNVTLTRIRRVVEGVAADVILPPEGPFRSPVFCCLPGGGVSRRYWDLDGDRGFAAAMAEAGFPVITLDHLGTGDSRLSEPAEPPLLGEVVAADDTAFRLLLDELRATTPGLRSVGVGHSMGSALTLRQQARHRTHDAIALLGFSIRGLPSVLPPEILDACADGIPDDRELARLTLLKFGSPYPDLGGDQTEYRTVLLGAGGLLSLLPGNVAAEAAQVTVPVLLANGDRDPLVGGGPPDTAPYTRAAHVTAFVVPDAGHDLLFGPSRQLLVRRLQQWGQSASSALT